MIEHHDLLLPWGSVITGVLPLSMRVFPSPERTMRETDCSGGPPCAHSVTV